MFSAIVGHVLQIAAANRSVKQRIEAHGHSHIAHFSGRKNRNESAEVLTLSLTFDHRVVNGAGAAAFANEIKKQIEGFKIPEQEKRAAPA
ncbi:MAG: 2-oxo acid dehydrogenase subunit E2 [Terriglobales bacterium]